MLFFRDFSCGFRVPSTCRDPQGEMMCLRSAKIAATNDRCPSCPPRHFPLFASPESDCDHLPKAVFWRAPPCGNQKTMLQYWQHTRRTACSPCAGNVHKGRVSFYADSSEIALSKGLA